MLDSSVTIVLSGFFAIMSPAEGLHFSALVWTCFYPRLGYVKGNDMIRCDHYFFTVPTVNFPFLI